MTKTIDLAEAQLLLAHVLDVDSAYLLAHPQPRLSLWQRWRYARLLRRRIAGWPIAYLVGEKWFYGRPFWVNRHVLIPRPETELLVDVTIEAFQSFDVLNQPIIIDIGTGSGCIAITLAAELSVMIIATDTSRRALAMAKRNARRHDVQNLITFSRGNLLGNIDREVAAQRFYNHPLQPKTYNLKPTIIVANLPYLPANHVAAQTPYEPHGALYGGGQDGLGYIRALIDECRDEACLVSTAVILEIDPRQADAVRDLLAQRLPPGVITIHNDLAGRPRAAVWVRRDV